MGFEIEEKIYDYGDRYSDPNRTNLLTKPVKEGTTSGAYKMMKMYDNHHEIARRLVLGEKPKDIARDLGCNPQTISNVRNSPIVQDKLRIMHAVRDAGTIELAQEIDKLAPLALQRVEEALRTGKVLDKELSGSSILREANNIIDRSQGKPTQTIHTKNLHGHFTVEDIDAIKEKAKKLASSTDQML